MSRDEDFHLSPDVVINLLRETCERLRAVDAQVTSSARSRWFFLSSAGLLSIFFSSSLLAYLVGSREFLKSPIPLFLGLGFVATYSFTLLLWKTRRIYSVEQAAQGALLARLRRLVGLGSQMHDMGDLTASERLRLDIALADAEMILVSPAAQGEEHSIEIVVDVGKPRLEPNQTRSPTQVRGV